MKEIWKDIENFEDYQISNFGNCRRKKSKDSKGNLRKEKILKQNEDIYGYYYYALCKNGKRSNHYIHRLVSKHFLNNYEKNKQINHIDGNKLNNVINNLEMVTDKENKEHGWRLGLYKYNKKRYKNIGQYTLDWHLIKIWGKVNEISKELNCTKQRIYNCLAGKQKTAFGYRWKEVD